MNESESNSPHDELFGADNRQHRVANWLGTLFVAFGLMLLIITLASGVSSWLPQVEPAVRMPIHLVVDNGVSSEPPENPLDALRAYRYLEQICALGPRPSGSDGMKQQQDLLVAHFEAFGGKVTRQTLQARNPLGGPHVPMTNLIIEWHPERDQRVLLCAHYDTRPLPDRDPIRSRRENGTFIGANDGGSGVAVLMELAHLMGDLDSEFGVDFVLFDGEEFVYEDGRDPYFWGSTWFAREYDRKPPAHRYRWGVLMDMVGDADLRIYKERQSATWRDTKPLVAQIWATAERLGVEEFNQRVKYEVQDDHVPLRNLAKIPTCDIIDFEYPHWHTESDTPRQCSPSSLAKVGWVLYEWLRTVESQ